MENSVNNMLPFGKTKIKERAFLCLFVLFLIFTFLYVSALWSEMLGAGERACLQGSLLGDQEVLRA